MPASPMVVPTELPSVRRPQVLAAPEVIAGIPLPARSVVVWGTTTDAPLSVAPASDLEVWGLLLAAGEEIRFDLGGPLGPQRSGVLAAEARSAGRVFATGSALVFDCPDPCDPARPFEGIVRGGTLARPSREGAVRWPAGAELVWSASGAVAQAGLPRDETVRVPGDPPLRASALSAVTFFDDGTRQRLTLHRAARVGGLPAAAGAPVAFGPSGELAALTLGRDAVVAGYTLLAGTRITFSGGGAVVLTSPIPQAIAGLPLGPETISLELGPDGAPVAIVTEADFEVRGVPVDGTDRYRVLFHPDGSIALARLAEPWTRGGVVFEAGAYVQILADGTVERMEPSAVEDR